MTSSALIEQSNFSVAVHIPVTHKVSMDPRSGSQTVVTECHIGGQVLVHSTTVTRGELFSRRFGQGDPLQHLIDNNIRAIKHTLEQ